MKHFFHLYRRRQFRIHLLPITTCYWRWFLLPIIYLCRHCGQKIGSIQQKVLDTTMLGFDQLTMKEKEEMITYKPNGDAHIKVICENCEEALGHHPHYHELDFFIQ